MATANIYLNFNRNTEEAFMFYKSVFGGEFEGGISRMGDAPPQGEMHVLSEEDKNLVMHICLPIFSNLKLMGTDATESMGFKLIQGNNVYISLHPDSRGDTDRLFAALSEGGEVEMAPAEMFWGDYFASCTDKFGIRWMFNCESKI